MPNFKEISLFFLSEQTYVKPFHQDEDDTIYNQ